MPKQMSKNKTVAIIEDDPVLNKTLGDGLEDAGYRVIQATNGKEGLALVLKEHPDLILLDIVMPEMDGITMLNSLRQDYWGGDVPVIVLSNLSEPAEITEALAHSAFDYLVKSSWKLKDVVKKVESKLK